MRPILPIALRQLPRARPCLVSRGLASSAIRSVAESSSTPRVEDQADPGAVPGAPEKGTSPGLDEHRVFKASIQLPTAKWDPEAMTTLEVIKPGWVSVQGQKLNLRVRKDRNLSLPFFYLRDRCKCPSCVDPYSKQRSFRTSDIPFNIHPRHVRWDGEQLQIKWRNDIDGYDAEHTTTLDRYILGRRNHFIDTHDNRSEDMAPRRWNAPLMEHVQHWVSFEDYMNDDAKFAAAMRNLSRMGLIFVKDIPKSREMVEKIATRMGPLRNSFYGSTWDVKTVPQAKNVAYTNQHLGFHMDLLYMNEPPGYQLLHCLENSCEGGESLFADTFRIADVIKQDQPDQWRELTQRRLGYEYVHEDSIYHNTWPVIEVDEKTSDTRHVNYSPPFQSALPGVRIREEANHDNHTLFRKGLRRFAGLLEKPKYIFQLKLNPGECVIFANRRIVHARNKFNTTNGSRWLAGAYVDEDALLSRFAVCKRKNWAAWEESDPVPVLRRLRDQRLAQAGQNEALGAQEDASPVDPQETVDEAAVAETPAAEPEHAKVSS